jgi:hypothetical protein
MNYHVLARGRPFETYYDRDIIIHQLLCYCDIWLYVEYISLLLVIFSFSLRCPVDISKKASCKRVGSVLIKFN